MKNDMTIDCTTYHISRRAAVFLFLSLLGFVGVGASPLSPLSPADSLKRFVKSIYTYNYLFPREQVYLHFDNTGYFMGETIWFKAHVVNPDGRRESKKAGKSVTTPDFGYANSNESR